MACRSKSAYSNHQNWRHTAGRGAFSAAEAPKTQEALMAFKFLGQRQLGKLPSRWVSTILMVAIGCGDGRPFLGWCVTEEVYSLTACPAGGHFLVRQKVTKERPGLRPGPDGQRRQSLGGRSPNAAWTAWARFFCLGDSLNLIVWLLDAWLGGWPCGGTGFSSLAGGALWPAPSFRLA